MKPVFIIVLILFTQYCFCGDTMSYDQFKYRILHYTPPRPISDRIITKNDYIMSAITTTGVTITNIVVFSRGPITHMNYGSDKVYKNQLKIGVLVLDAFFIAIQVIHYTRKH